MTAPAISRRRVHYIGGFDPRGARFYRQLYAREAPLQARQSPLSLRVGALCKSTTCLSGWQINSDSGDGKAAQTDYQFLGWDDLVREQWRIGKVRLLATSIPIYATYLLRGGFKKVRALSRTAFLSGIFPVAYLLLLGGLSCAALWGGLAWLETAGGGYSWKGGVLGLLLALSGARVGLRWAERLGVLWLLRTYVFLHRWRAGDIPVVDQRVEEMSAHILRCAREDPVEETLIVGHSVGTIFAVLVMARIVEKMKQESRSADLVGLHLLTLGQCLPLVNFMPNEAVIRDRLKLLNEHPDLLWTDVSAKADPLCFCCTDPVKAGGVDGPNGSFPSLKLVRFFKMFSSEKYRRMRWNKVRLHFQYLMAGELPTGYDYFAMTAGTQRLEDYLRGME